MPYKDLHDEPFDESTIAKLEIFEDYAQAWIPTFVMQGKPVICIFDFFAGTGYDKNGIPGSPIRVLKKIQEQKGHLFQKNVSVVLYLNEFEPNKKKQKKFEQLTESCKNFMDTDKSLANKVEIKLFNEDFETLFPKLFKDIEKHPSLVYLDQNGIKYLSDKYFLELEKTQQTDFLYFVSASYFWRFGDSKEFKMHFDIDVAEAKKHGYKHIHRFVTEQLRNKLPNNTELKLYPFSLKKGANIHGVIFGAKHPRAVDKFLTIGWKRNGTNGDANFDIDEDAGKAQLSMFSEQKLTKKESFKRDVRELVLNGSLTNNFDLLAYTYAAGHIGKHASDCLLEMKRNKEIDFDGRSPLITYDCVHNYKKRKQVFYKLIKK
ncbi:MAG: three-Cys-motif partner protein TcmP [Fulvivirga sp.]